MKSIICFCSLLLILAEQSCISQNGKSSGMITREPVVAGRFYPSSENELRNSLNDYFNNVEPHTVEGTVRAVIVPHAGYVFSGEVAAHGFNQVPANKIFDNIFILGSSHYAYFNGASIYNVGNYRTPLGKVKVNVELANELIDKYPCFSYEPEAHHKEHSLEVQIPFIQSHFKTVPSIIPIIIGTQQLSTIEKIAEALKPYFNKKNLFVISTDFSHYPSYLDAVQADENTANAIIKNDPREFLKAIKENKKQDFENLQTSICGWTSVLSLLHITEGQKNIEYTKVLYRNSGDQPFGSKDRVVGYYSLVITEKDNLSKTEKDFSLSEEDKKKLLEIARNAISTHAINGRIPALEESKLSDALKTATGAFVSLHKYDKLRGCIGRFQAADPLYKVVQEMAVASAFQDHRFPPVTPDEIPELTIEISVLTPMKRIQNINEIKIGRHGVYMVKGSQHGTFLPQVATETGWDLEHFLGHCARDKAKIGWDGWKSADLFVYEAEIFDEHLLLP